ncbi:CRISPR-associated protein Csx3 [Archaeoglobales archaeon]|nr:MAG: CRISPR-associated protein Csx3 [Archaeoglobales archaeon]
MSDKLVVKVSEHEDFVLVDIAIGGNGLIAPEELSELISVVEKAVSNAYFGKGVVISGRLPIWAHSALAHTFHGAKWVAHFDPRLGAVVSATHDTTKPIGTVIPHDKLNI